MGLDLQKLTKSSHGLTELKMGKFGLSTELTM